MESFSERNGFRKPKMELQIDEVDDPLRAGLWNFIDFASLNNEDISGYDDGSYSDQFETFTMIMWHSFFNFAVDTRPRRASEAKQVIRDRFFSSGFPELYDILEFIGSNTDREKEFHSLCNKVLECEKSAFRFVGQHLTQITNNTEIVEIEVAQDQNKSKSVSSHINAAVSLYSNRKKPDYRNSIKESISAVEAAAKKLAGPDTKTLGEALKVLGKNGTLHKALASGYSSLYGWTNDSEGIRHALMDEATITEADARYMLVSCSAFSNYLLSKI